MFTFIAIFIACLCRKEAVADNWPDELEFEPHNMIMFTAPFDVPSNSISRIRLTSRAGLPRVAWFMKPSNSSRLTVSHPPCGVLERNQQVMVHISVNPNALNAKLITEKVIDDQIVVDWANTALTSLNNCDDESFKKMFLRRKVFAVEYNM